MKQRIRKQLVLIRMVFIIPSNRAARFGWNNTYQLTKAMGEMVLNESRGDVPLLIIRPTINIESRYKEPFPGWIQGNRTASACFSNPEVVMDLIPVDFVKNITIEAIAKHGNIRKPHEVNVYHVASSAMNPLRASDAFEYLYEYFSATPLIKSQNIARIKIFNNFNDFSEYIREEIYQHNRPRHTIGQDENTIWKLRNQCNAKISYAEQLCRIYEFVGFFSGRFHIGNTQKLIDEMPEDDQINFEVDARNIDWKKYLQEIHIPGLRKHIINSDRRTSI